MEYNFRERVHRATIQSARPPRRLCATGPCHSKQIPPNVPAPQLIDGSTIGPERSQMAGRLIASPQSALVLPARQTRSAGRRRSETGNQPTLQIDPTASAGFRGRHLGTVRPAEFLILL